MPYDEKLAVRVRRALARAPGVVEKKMFGGLCFMVNGRMCCGVLKGDLVVRVGPERHSEALAAPHARPMDFTGRPMKGFVYVGPAGWKSPAALGKWVSWAVEFAAEAPAAKRKNR